MLIELHIKNLALIKKADIYFKEGLSVLSGETGAGKSILIDSINLALGAKASKDIIRTGENEGFVELIFTLDEKRKEKLKNLDISFEDDLLIITADHGNDPTYTGTDHTREKVPFIAYSKSFKGSGSIPERNTFADMGATIAENFGVKMPEGTIGSSMLGELV